jgi:hypothetical protein
MSNLPSDLSTSPALDCFMARLRSHHHQNSSSMETVTLSSIFDESSNIPMETVSAVDDSFSPANVLHLVPDNARARSSSISSQNERASFTNRHSSTRKLNLSEKFELPSVNEQRKTKGKDRWLPMPAFPGHHRHTSSSSSVSNFDFSPSFPSRGGRN